MIARFARSSAFSQEANGSVVKLQDLFASNYFKYICALFHLFFIGIINSWSTLMFTIQALNLQLQGNYTKTIDGQILICDGKIVITCSCI